MVVRCKHPLHRRSEDFDLSHMKGNKMTTSKAYKGLPMEGIIASWYSRITLKDLSRHKLMAETLAARQFRRAQACWRSHPAPAISASNWLVWGIIGSQAWTSAGPSWKSPAGMPRRPGFVSISAWATRPQLPFEDNCFDVTFCQAAFKNFTEPVKAISEMYRVLATTRKGHHCRYAPRRRPG